MRQSASHFNKVCLAVAAVAIITILVLVASCVPGNVTQTSGAGLPYIQSITANVIPTGSASASATMSPASTTPTSSGLGVTVTVRTGNFNIENAIGQPAVPGEGHLIFYLDAVPPTQPGVPAVTATGTYAAGSSTSYTWSDVSSGWHVFSAELVNNDQTPLSSPAVVSVLINVTGPVTIFLPAISMISAQIMWTGATPSTTISPVTSTSPSTTASPLANLMVSVQTSNFAIVNQIGKAAAQDVGHINFFLDAVPPTFPNLASVTLNGAYVPTIATSYPWTGVMPGAHILSAELVNNDNTPLNPPVVASVLITVPPSNLVTALPTTAVSPTATASPTVTASPTATASPAATASPTSTAFPTDSPNTITFGSRTIVKNQWGAPPDEKLTCEIYLNQDGSFGWYWDRPNPQVKPGNTNYQPIFPDVKIGSDVGEKPNNKNLPVKVSSIQQLQFNVSCNYPTPPSGSYNLAFQMYFADTDNPAPNTQANLEAMIWIQQTFGQPPKAFQGDFSDGYNNYALYSYTQFNGMPYSAFLIQGQTVFQPQYTVDAKKLLDDLNINPDWYLFSIHFGNEIYTGSAKIDITNYEITLNGQGL